MEEYLVDVIFDGKKEQLKTYSASPLEALDSMINFDEVSAINKITRVTDKKNIAKIFETLHFQTVSIDRFYVEKITY